MRAGVLLKGTSEGDQEPAEADMGQHDYEFDGFALQPGSGVLESLDAAGVDRHLPAPCPGMEDDHEHGF